MGGIKYASLFPDPLSVVPCYLPPLPNVTDISSYHVDYIDSAARPIRPASRAPFSVAPPALSPTDYVHYGYLLHPTGCRDNP